MRKKILAVMLLALSAPALTAANVIYVDCNGLNDPGSGTFEDPFRRIQDGINIALTGDIVMIRPGIYSGAGNYDLDPAGKSITISSTNPEDPEIVENTIIDPEGQRGGFYFQNSEDANCVIRGLTIQNAYSSYGGGIFCLDSSPTIYNCTIRNSSVMTYGGGIFCLGGSPQIIKCIISGNQSYRGGGIKFWSVQSIVKNCIIIDNMAMGNDGGGGIDCYDSNVILSNCTVAGNLASQGIGGGMLCINSDVKIENSIFWKNSASNGTQIGLEGEGLVSVNYCDAQGGQANVYDPCGLLAWGQGNIDIDPCFASFDFDEDPNLWDFHLQSKSGRWNPNISEWVIDANFSQCIDAGDTNSDWSSEPWPNGKRINMGAYGGTNQASKSGNLADFDVNGVVNLLDLMEFCSKWLDEQGGIVNLNLSGRVDFRDFAIFAENWLWEKE